MLSIFSIINKMHEHNVMKRYVMIPKQKSVHGKKSSKHQ